MTSNNALVPDPDKQDDLASKSWQWPILNVGLRMCGWDDHSKSLKIPEMNHHTTDDSHTVVKYFLLGNPLVYWSSTLSLFVLIYLTTYYLVRYQRGYVEAPNPALSPAAFNHYVYSGIYPFIGWLLHYLPFLIMARVTYVHHYYPALYFAILTAGFCIDWMTATLRKDVQWALYSVLYVLLAGLFWWFRAISFGMVGNHKQWAHLKWLDTWRITD